MAEWYTRTFEGRVERSVRVQVPPTTFFNKYMKYLIVNNTKNKELLEFPIIGFQDSLDAFLLAIVPSL